LKYGVITFAFVNGRSQTFALSISGECHDPELDRSIKTTFPKQAVRLEGQIQFAYVTELNSFTSGDRSLGKSEESHSRRSSITGSNGSSFPAELTFLLSESVAKAIWSIEARSAVIEIGSTFQLSFAIHPTIPDVSHTFNHSHFR
jgi:hypothetical protein